MIFPSHDFAQVQQVSNRRDQKSILLVFLHGPGNTSNRPAQRVQRVPRVLSAVQLIAQLFQHLLLGIFVVQVRQVNQRLAHDFVLDQNVVVFQRLAHDVSVFIFHDQHFFGFRHSRNHQHSQFTHRRGI